jgi:hypothetical protein
MGAARFRALRLTHFTPPKSAKPLVPTELDGNFEFHVHGDNINPLSEHVIVFIG